LFVPLFLGFGLIFSLMPFCLVVLPFAFILVAFMPCCLVAFCLYALLPRCLFAFMPCI
jgi:hypothetical protein